MEGVNDVFSSNRERKAAESEADKSALYQQIGQLKVELDWLKKNLALSVEQKRRLIEKDHAEVPVARQCELLGLARSSYYHEPTGESASNLELMRLIDEIYTEHPYFGIRRMVVWLRKLGRHVNKKRVSRLMQRMGLQAIYEVSPNGWTRNGHS